MISKYVSAITSPFLIIPIFALWIIATYSKSLNEFTLWGATFIFLTVIPTFIYVYRGVKQGEFTDLHVAIKEQRDKPFLIAILGSLLLIGAYFIEQVPREIFSLSIILLVNGIIFYLITKLSKVSIHAAAFAGSIFIATILISGYTALLLLFLPLVIWARIKRDRHNLWQAVASVILIGLTTIITFYFLNLF